MEVVARDLRTRLDMLAVTVGWHRFGYPDGAFTPVVTDGKRLYVVGWAKLYAFSPAKSGP